MSYVLGIDVAQGRTHAATCHRQDPGWGEPEPLWLGERTPAAASALFLDDEGYLLTGDAAELGPWLAEHADVDAIDLTGASPRRAMELERAAADTVKRLIRTPADEPDWTADPGLGRMTPFLETKTVWHPIGV